MNCVLTCSRLRRSVAVVACVVWLTSGVTPASVGAADEATEPVAELTATAQAVLDLGMAHDLIDYGRRTKTPEALLAAALILHRLPTAKAEDKADAEAPAAIDLAGLLAEAKKLRPGDSTLAAAVARAVDTIQEQSRGATTGPRSWGAMLPRGASQTIRQPFKARELAVVRLSGSPRPSFGQKPFAPVVEVVVTNAKGQTVARQVGTSLQLQFVPTTTEVCQVRVTNRAGGAVFCQGYHN